MKKLLSGLCATTLALSFAAATVAPAAAAPVAVPKVESGSDVQLVQDRVLRRLDRRIDRLQDRRDRRETRRFSRDFERRGDFYYYNGHRGFRDRRPGYRYHNGYWFPAAAFIAGALITGAIADEPEVRVVRRGVSAHEAWCYDRYKSYRASDNTYQPYEGPRRECYSPYD